MKTIAFAVIVGMALVQGSFAQERSATGAAETQMSWSALSNQVSGISTRIDAVNSRVDQAVACGRANMLYAPGATGANSAGCKAIPTPAAPSLRTAMAQQYLPSSGSLMRVDCASNERLTGGGGSCDGAINCRQAVNMPNGNGWLLGGFADSGSPLWTAYAICMRN